MSTTKPHTPDVGESKYYSVPRPAAADKVDLWLDANEGAPWPEVAWPSDSDLVRRYPDDAPLTQLLADHLRVPPEQLLVTAGADEAIDRLCKALLRPGREIVFPSPSFEMIWRHAEACGGATIRVPWSIGGPWPTDGVIAATSPRTAIVAAVSPNNPTGGTLSIDDLRRVSAARPSATLMVDLAYAEFADHDLTAEALKLPGAVVIRTLSKAWSMAGLRIGYAIGPRPVIEAMRSAGCPYPVSAVALSIAHHRVSTGVARMRTLVEQVRHERAELTRVLHELGATTCDSQANFVLARFADAPGVWERLAEHAIAVRIFRAPELAGWLRIGCPGDARSFARLTAALRRCVR